MNEAPTLVASRTALPPEGAQIGQGGPAPISAWPKWCCKQQL